MVKVQDCIEDQRIIADSFSAIDGVIREEEHVSFAEVRVDDDCVLGDRALIAEQAGEQHVLSVRKAKNDIGAQGRWNYGGIVAKLLFVERLRLPWLLFDERLRVNILPTLNDVAVIDGSAACGALRIRVHERAEGASAPVHVADIEGHTVCANHGNGFAIAISDWILRCNKD